MIINARAIPLALLCLTVGCRTGSSVEAPTSYLCSDCNVVLISIDTLRADHLGCYGYPRSTSPVLDAFAKKSTQFARLINSGGSTLAIHMSMMTSLPPTVHEVLTTHPRRLDEARVTLAEQLRSRGYATAGFTDNGWMLGSFGFDKGFDVYNDKGGHLRRILPRAYAWLAEHRSQKFFLFLHTYDVHSGDHRLPYEPPAPYDDLYTAGYSGHFWGCVRGACATNLLVKWNSGLATGRRREDVLAEEDLRYLVDLYDGGITYVDHQIGEFLDKLRAWSPDRKTIVVITSDHGEEFLEHGLFLHWQNYEEIAHVPLFIRLPELPTRAEKVDALVSTLDIMPTILDALGIPPSPDVQGRSLVPLILGAKPQDDARAILVAENKEKLRTSGWSLLLWGDTPVELYDLSKDPGEHTNVLPSFPAVAKDLLGTFRSIRGEENKLRVALGTRPAPQAEISTEEVQRLKALGYLH